MNDDNVNGPASSTEPPSSDASPTSRREVDPNAKTWSWDDEVFEDTAPPAPASDGNDTVTIPNLAAAQGKKYEEASGDAVWDDDEIAPEKSEAPASFSAERQATLEKETPISGSDWDETDFVRNESFPETAPHAAFAHFAELTGQSAPAKPKLAAAMEAAAPTFLSPAADSAEPGLQGASAQGGPTESLGWASTGEQANPASSRSSSRPTATQAGNRDASAAKANNWVVLGLVAWASLATFVAFYLWWNWPEDRSALENLPDDGKRAQVVSPTEKLSRRETVRLGETKRLGMLEVTPVAIESRQVRFQSKDIKNDEPFLVLRLRVKNISTDHSFYPLEEAFLYPQLDKKVNVPLLRDIGLTYTFLHPAGNASAVLEPLEDTHLVAAQTYPKLDPGEEAEVFIVSGEDAPKKLKPDMVWRVGLRKGKAANGRSVTTVVGVPFRQDDVVPGSKLAGTTTTANGKS